MPPTVLCVDDDRSLCQILARALSGEGYAVRTAHDGEEALAFVRANPPDLLLLDVMLPKRDGFEVLDAMRRQGGALASLPVVLLSGGSGSPQYQERARTLHAQAMLTKPVPLEVLTGVIRKALGQSRPVQVSKGREDDKRRPPELSGSLTELSFPALLHHLHGLRANGVLELVSGRKRKALQISDGRPVGVRSNLLHECLGNLLVRSGRIRQQDLDESVRRMRGGEGLQGEILVAMQLLSEAELGAVLRDQAEEKLFEIFTWRKGRFRFQPQARLARASVLALGRSPANVILTGVRNRMPMDLVDGFLAAKTDCYVVPGESPFYRFQEIDLEPNEKRLLEKLSASPRLGDLLLRGEPTRRTLYALIATDLVELGSRPAAPPAPQPSAPPASVQPTPNRGEDPEEGIRAELGALAERLRGQDYFAILGVSESAGEAEIQRAYVEAAKRTHPDRFSSDGAAVKRLAEEVFGLISRAYETLSDPRQREAYQLGRRADSREAAELEEGRRALEAELRFREGEKLLRKRDYQAALRCFEESVRTYPDEGEYHAYRGWALFLTRPGDPAAEREALLHIRRGHKLAPDREKPYLFLGRIHRAAGRSANAEKCFTRALQINPESVEAQRELRLINLRREKAKGLIGRWLRR